MNFSATCFVNMTIIIIQWGRLEVQIGIANICIVDAVSTLTAIQWTEGLNFKKP